MRSDAAVRLSSLPERSDQVAKPWLVRRRSRLSFLKAEVRWWLHRRRVQWKQTLAALLVAFGTFGVWLLLVEEVLE